MNKTIKFQLILLLCLLMSFPLVSFEISEKYRDSHTEFEINFIESLSGLSGFDELTKNQLSHLEKYFDSYVKEVYGSMERAHSLLAYSLDEYAHCFNDLIKLIKIDLINLNEPHS